MHFDVSTCLCSKHHRVCNHTKCLPIPPCPLQSMSQHPLPSIQVTTDLFSSHYRLIFQILEFHKNKSHSLNYLAQYGFEIHLCCFAHWFVLFYCQIVFYYTNISFLVYLPGNVYLSYFWVWLLWLKLLWIFTCLCGHMFSFLSMKYLNVESFPALLSLSPHFCFLELPPKQLSETKPSPQVLILETSKLKCYSLTICCSLYFHWCWASSPEIFLTLPFTPGTNCLSPRDPSASNSIPSRCPGTVSHMWVSSIWL